MITLREKKFQKIGRVEYMNETKTLIESHFGQIAGLIGERSRAIILWNLLDGKAYTATELAICADISKQACSSHLQKLVKAELISMEKQGRHRYYRFANDRVAQVIESIGALLPVQFTVTNNQPVTGLKFARTCYDHLAGRVGVVLTETLVNKGALHYQGDQFIFSEYGATILSEINIELDKVRQGKRKFAFPCLDWSERRYHLGGALGAALLQQLVKKDWVRKSTEDRQIVLTSAGKKGIWEWIGVEL